MAPRITSRAIRAKDDCTTRRTPGETLSSWCVLLRSKDGATNDVREARAPQSCLRGGVKDGRRDGVRRWFGTKGSIRHSAAPIMLTASNVIRNGWGGNQRRVRTEQIRNGGVAEEAEWARTAGSRCSLQGEPNGVRVVERNVLRMVSASPDFCNAWRVEALPTKHRHYPHAL